MDASMAVAVTRPANALWATAQESAAEQMRFIWRRELPTTLALLDAGAEIHLADKDGRTPLHAAVPCAMPDLVARLIHAKADVNRTTEASRTPVDLSIYWAVQNPINNRDSTAIIRLLVLAGGLAGQEIGVSAEPDGQQHQTSLDSENDGIWMAQCRRTSKLLKEWYVPPPGSTSEVRLDSRTAGTIDPGPASKPAQCTPARPAAAIVDGTPTVPGSNVQDDDLTAMIHKLTDEWDRNEVVSIRIPVVLENLNTRMDEPDLPMHLFLGFNYTTVVRHGIRGALGLPRKSGSRVAIELLTTRATADQWGRKNDVPPTDLLRTLPPGATPADVRSEIQGWFEMYSPQKRKTGLEEAATAHSLPRRFNMS